MNQAQQLGNIGSWEWNTGTNISVWSDEMYRIFGVEKDEFNPTIEKIEKIILEEDRIERKYNIDLLLNGGLIDFFEFRIKRPNGEIRNLLVLSIKRGTNENSDIIYGVTQDITENKIIEGTILQQNKKSLDSDKIFPADEKTK